MFDGGSLSTRIGQAGASLIRFTGRDRCLCRPVLRWDNRCDSAEPSAIFAGARDLGVSFQQFRIVRFSVIRHWFFAAACTKVRFRRCITAQCYHAEGLNGP